MRARTCWPARDPATCRRSDFHPGGFRAEDEGSFRIEVEDFAEHCREVEALGRRRIERPALLALHTPWGAPDHATQYAEGILRVSTPGHGGFVLSAERNAAVDPRWAADCGMHAFYEEDEEWAKVAFTFGDLFTRSERLEAERTLIRSHPDQWEAVTGRMIPDGQSPTRERARWMAANAGRWMGRAAIRSKVHPGMTVVTATIDAGPPSSRSRLYLVPDDRYDGGRRNPAGTYLIDETADQPVNQREEPLILAAAA
jgi:hypothetical protein